MSSMVGQTSTSLNRNTWELKLKNEAAASRKSRRIRILQKKNKCHILAHEQDRCSFLEMLNSQARTSGSGYQSSTVKRDIFGSKSLYRMNTSKEKDF
jgi:hypothetical protein